MSTPSQRNCLTFRSLMVFGALSILAVNFQGAFQTLKKTPFSDNDARYHAHAESPGDLRESAQTIAAAQNEQFYRDGFLQTPLTLMTQEEAHLLSAELDRHAEASLQYHQRSGIWPKGGFLTNLAMQHLALHPAILSSVSSLLGEKVILWGGSLVKRLPGQHHRWHTDLETMACPRSVSVWIALENVTQETTPKILRGSHRLGMAANTFRSENAEVLTWNWSSFVSHQQALYDYALNADPRACVIEVDARDGQAIFFHGQVWHGTSNPTNRTRVAALLQFATPDCAVRSFWGRHVPLLLTGDESVPVSLVHGNLNDLTPLEKARNTFVTVNQAPMARNTLVTMNQAPVDTLSLASPNGLLETPEQARQWVATVDSNRVLTSFVGVHTSPVLAPGDSGLRLALRFQGSSDILAKIEFHTSIQEQYVTPHAPHNHEDEEVIHIKEGVVRITFWEGLEDIPRAADFVAGDVVYHSRRRWHTITALSNTATYTCVRFIPRRSLQEFLSRDDLFNKTDQRIVWSSMAGIHIHRPTGIFLEASTDGLARLHAHVTELSPGQGYEPHVDAYDVLILVEEGTLLLSPENATVTRWGAVYTSAGHPHGLKNIGFAQARYLVFEFHE